MVRDSNPAPLGPQAAPRYNARVTVALVERAPNARGSRAREKVLLAATQMFAERGYAGASIADIAEAAGVTKPALLYHFGDKERLWRDAVDALWAEVDAFYAARWPRDAISARGYFERTLDLFVEAALRWPAYVRIPFIEGATESWRSRWLVDRHFGDHVKFTERTIRAAQRAGDLPEGDPAHLISVMTSGVNVFVSQRAMWNRAFGRELGDAAALRAHIRTVLTLTFRSETMDSGDESGLA